MNQFMTLAASSHKTCQLRHQYRRLKRTANGHKQGYLLTYKKAEVKSLVQQEETMRYQTETLISRGKTDHTDVACQQERISGTDKRMKREWLWKRKLTEEPCRQTASPAKRSNIGINIGIQLEYNNCSSKSNGIKWASYFTHLKREKHCFFSYHHRTALDLSQTCLHISPNNVQSKRDVEERLAC